MRALFLAALLLLPAGAGAAEQVRVTFGGALSIELPVGTRAASVGGEPIATLDSARAATGFGAAVSKSVSGQSNVLIYPTSSEQKVISLGWVTGAKFADEINALSRLEFIKRQAVMSKRFFDGLEKEPGEHATESSAITFHDKYRGLLFLALTKRETGVLERLVLDIFRRDTVFSVRFSWTRPELDRQDPLLETIVDSVDVSE